MDQVDTLHVGRYWSEVLCCTIMTRPGELEVKVMALKILVKVLGKRFLKSIYLYVDGSSRNFACLWILV